jgi:glycerol-3-phosphate dehydrogenase
VKGSHIVVPRVHPEEHAYILQNADNRIVFVIPFEQHYSLIGTTDIAVDDYADPKISDDEIAYLLTLANAYLATPLSASDIVWTYSGVRPLYDDGSSDPSAVTRDYVLKVDAGDDGKAPPVLSIFGGKITTYRKLAESALKELLPFFPAMKAPWTRTEVLPGGDLPGSDMRNGARAAFLASLCRRYPGLPDSLLRALAHRYGTRALELLGDARTPADLGPDFGATLSGREIDFLMREEWAKTAEDVLWRRTKCGLPMSPEQRDAVREYMSAAQG